MKILVTLAGLAVLVVGLIWLAHSLGRSNCELKIEKEKTLIKTKQLKSVAYPNLSYPELIDLMHKQEF